MQQTVRYDGKAPPRKQRIRNDLAKKVEGAPSYAEIKTLKDLYSPRLLIETLKTEVAEGNWKHVHDIIDNWPVYSDEPDIPLFVWNTLFHRLSYYPVFPEFMEKYSRMDQKPSAAIASSLLFWLTNEKQYDSLKPAFETISEPTAQAYRTYIAGLLRSQSREHHLEARDAMRRMISDRRELEGDFCASMLKKVGCDFDTCCEFILEMEEAGLPISESMLFVLAHRIRTLAEFEWFIAKGTALKLLKASTLGRVLCSPWAKEPTFSLKLVAESYTSLNMLLQPSFCETAVRLCESDREIVELLALDWTLPDRDLLTRLIGTKVKASFLNRSSSAISAHYIRKIWANGINKETCILAGRVAIHHARLYGAFDMALTRQIVEKLMFYGQAKLSTELVLGLLNGAIGSGELLRILKILLEGLKKLGQYSLGRQVTRELAGKKSEALLPSLQLGLALFCPSRAKAIDIRSVSDARHLSLIVDSLNREDALDQGLSLYEQFQEKRPEDIEDPSLFALLKLDLAARMPGNRDKYISILEELKALEGGCYASLCDYGISLARGEKPKNPIEPFSGRNTMGAKLANRILTNANFFQPLKFILKVKNDLCEGFGPNVVSLNLYRTYINSMIHHLEETAHVVCPSPTDILNEIDSSGLGPDMKVYQDLIQYAMKLEDFDQVNRILQRLIQTGGVLNQPILERLFTWLQAHGDLNTCLGLYEMSQKNGVGIPAIAYDTIVGKYLTQGMLPEAREWIMKASSGGKPDGSPRAITRCFEPIISEYFDQFYKSHPISECQAELDALLRQGYHVPGNIYFGLLDQALHRKDYRGATHYLNRLIHQRTPPPVEKYLELAELLLLDGWLDLAHQVFASIKTSKPAGFDSLGACQSFDQFLSDRLPSCLAEKPSLFDDLKIPGPGQPSFAAKSILSHVNRMARPVQLREVWCQRVLMNLLAWGDFEGAEPFAVYMMTKGMSFGERIAERVCAHWLTRI